MGTIQANIPNTPNTVSDSWEPLVGQHVICRQGDNHISLTEWVESNTDRPEVAGGSSIEVNGSIVSYVGDTAIVDDTGLAAGTVYLLIDTADAVDGIPTLVNDAPVWVASKNGFYRGANERYTGHQMEWDGITSYTQKNSNIKSLDVDNIALSPDGFKIYKMDTRQFAGTYGTATITTSGWVIPAGAYMFTTQESLVVYFEMRNSSGSWITGSSAAYGFMVSDGYSYRFILQAGYPNQTIYYRKIW